MAKQAKLKQTDWTTGGRDISNTAIPLYQKNLNQLGTYMDNVQNRLDPYVEKYGNLANAAEQSDFLRNYQRAMGNATGSNYAATTGGYSSLNQQGYDDYQRYYNDLAARMYANNMSNFANLANQEYDMLRGAANTYKDAYGLGQNYSNIDQYNDLVNQSNKNWISDLLTSAGDSIGAISMNSNNPWVAAIGGTIGGTMGTAGRMSGTDTSGAMAFLRGGNTGTTTGQYSAGDTTNAGQKAITSGLSDLFGNYKWYNNAPKNKFAESVNAPAYNDNPRFSMFGY